MRYEFPGRSLLGGLLLVPLVLPPFVGAIGVRFLLGRLGPLSALLGLARGAGFDWLGKGKLLGVLAVESLSLYPIMLLNLQAALANIDPAMEQAAANLGASRWTIFRRITLPLIRPGLFAGCTIVLIWSFTELGTPLMFDFNTVTPVQVFRSAHGGVEQPAAVRAGRRGAGGVHAALRGRARSARPAGRCRHHQGLDRRHAPRGLRGWQGAAGGGVAMAVVFLLAVLPHVVGDPDELHARPAQWYRIVLPAALHARPLPRRR